MQEKSTRNKYKQRPVCSHTQKSHKKNSTMKREMEREREGTSHKFNCHPCSGSMLFSESLQF